MDSADESICVSCTIIQNIVQLLVVQANFGNMLGYVAET